MFNDCAVFDLVNNEKEIFLSETYVASFNIAQQDYTVVKDEGVIPDKNRMVIRFKNQYFCQDAVTLEAFKKGMQESFAVIWGVYK